MKMKRKDLDQINDEFSDFSLSSPARKIRRLVLFFLFFWCQFFQWSCGALILTIFFDFLGCRFAAYY